MSCSSERTQEAACDSEGAIERPARNLIPKLRSQSMVPNNTSGYAYALAIRRPRGHGEALVLLADSETGSGRVTFIYIFYWGSWVIIIRMFCGWQFPEPGNANDERLLVQQHERAGGNLTTSRFVSRLISRPLPTRFTLGRFENKYPVQRRSWYNAAAAAVL